MLPWLAAECLLSDNSRQILFPARDGDHRKPVTDALPARISARVFIKIKLASSVVDNRMTELNPERRDSPA
jgi:hypothetical protein